MPEIRSTAAIATKWLTVTPQRRQQYENGLKNPKKDWETETLAAEDAYEEGIQAAIADKRFGKGVKAAGTAKWQEKALTLGVNRWPTGVQAAGEDYEKGFGPYRDVIERTTLSPRFKRGDPRNYDRTREMGTALHDARLRGGR